MARRETPMSASEEQQRLNALLSGKEVERIDRVSQNEIVIFFAGGARLFLEVDSEGNIALSVTGA